MMHNFVFICLSQALAQEPTETESETVTEKKMFSVSEFRLTFRGVGEAWKDASISQIYRSSRFLGNVGFGYRFHPNLSAYFDAGYSRADGNQSQSAFQIVPTAFGVSWVFGNGNIEPFAGLGLSLVSFTEELPSSFTHTHVQSSGSISGTKIGTDFRLGARVGTRVIQPTQHPNGPKGPSQMDIEFLVGGRVHHAFGIGNGFDLGAFRFGVGAVFRF